MGWSQAEILAATGGKIMRQGHETRFGEVVTDSNKVKNGAVFVALKGERHDGHRFVGEAVRRGARCRIIHRRGPVSAFGQATAVRVRDTLRALGDLAHYRRGELRSTLSGCTG